MEIKVQSDTSGDRRESSGPDSRRGKREKVADLYIIHGWTYTVEPWKATLKMLADNGLRVKMLRVPGLTEPSNKVYTIDDYVAWADAEIPDGAVALGHSNGGRILLNLCARKPDKLSRLVLLDAAGIYEPTRKKRVVQKLSKIGKPLKRIPLVNKAFHRLTGTTDYSHAPENMKETLVNMLSSDKDLDFSKVKTRTYILWGKKDTTTPPRQATAMYEKLPNAELKYYANWTHAPYISDPEGLARAIMALMNRVRKQV
ncbi:alpha/beta hydrolase [Candidatus Saccharibacteria bacterium]|nr:alpha/beta hydrolase [Candidatus Saccharibacteria bacterium]